MIERRRRCAIFPCERGWAQPRYRGLTCADPAATWNGGAGKEFVFNTASHELWYFADGTGTDKIDLAHISTGVQVQLFLAIASR